MAGCGYTAPTSESSKMPGSFNLLLLDSELDDLLLLQLQFNRTRQANQLLMPEISLGLWALNYLFELLLL